MDGIQLRRDVERPSYGHSYLRDQVVSQHERWTGKAPIKPRAKSEYSCLDKLHFQEWPDAEPDECHDSGVSLPLAVSQASNLHHERVYGLFDNDSYQMQGIRPLISNCRSEPSIPPRLNMEPLSQVRPGYPEARPASIHISTLYSTDHQQPATMHSGRAAMYRSAESMIHSVAPSTEQQRTSQSSVQEERHVVIERDPKRGFGFTIRTATNKTTHDRVKIKEVKEDSPAAHKGLIEGQILLQVNGRDIQKLSFEEIVFLIQNERNRVTLTIVPPTDPSGATPANINDVVHEGYLLRQTKYGGLKRWSKQWVVVKRDGCLYYCKSRDSAPSGTIVIGAYYVSKAVCSSRKWVLKFTRGAGVFLFAACSEQEYEEWAEVLADAKKTQSLSVGQSINNCAISALAIDKPLIAGWLLKLKLSGFKTKRKWCVLKDQSMFFFNDMHDSKAQEVLALTGYSLAATAVREHKHCFVLVPPTLKRFTSVLVFTAENRHSFDRWFKMLRCVLENAPMSSEEGSSSAAAPPSTPPVLPKEPQGKEYYRKKDIQNDSLPSFNTLVHTDSRPRSWHVRE